MRLWRPEAFWLILVAGVVALWWLPGMGSTSTDSYSVAFPGRKVLFQSLQRLGHDVRRNTDQLIPRPESGDRLLILGPARYPTSREWTALFDEVIAGGTLIVAATLNDADVDFAEFGAKSRSLFPKHAGNNFPLRDKSKEPTEKGEPTFDAEEPTSSADAASEEEEEEEVKRRPFKNWNESLTETSLVTAQVTWRTRGYLEFSAPDWEVLVTSASKPQVARRHVGLGTIVVSASDDIFSNGSLTDANKSLLAFRILECAPGENLTWFDETLNSSGVPKVIGMLFDPLFRSITLQCFLILAVYGWMGSFRFGAVQQIVQRRRRSIVEHARAVGILYFRAAAGAHAVTAMHDFLKLELRRLYGSGFHVDDAASVSRVAQTREEDVRSMMNQINTQSQRKLSSASAGRLLRSLSLLLSQVRTNQMSHGRQLKTKVLNSKSPAQ